MKILILSKRFYTGKDLVGDRYGRVFEFSRWLASRGHEVHGLAFDYLRRDTGQGDSGIAEAGLRWDIIKLFPGPVAGIGRYRASITKVVEGFSPDVVLSVSDVYHVQAVAEMCAADALVLIQAPSQRTVQAVAGKTFDYLRAGRPILAIGPEGDNMELIHRHAGRHEHPPDEPEDIARAIVRLHKEWESGAHIKHQVDPALFERYERRALTARLAAYFERLLNPGAP
ncbi:hypothetical protein N9985_02745 [Gammaproteobacteria bacterium]|nr:hypothetical protein [Gammaproteobacteria bacterium]